MAQQSILIVEDDPDIRESLVFLLENENFRVLAACHGQEALELLQLQGRPDLIILDLQMPVMNGETFLGALKSHHDHRFHRVPVVVLSATKKDNLSPAPDRYLSKPIDVGALLSVIETFLSVAHP